MKQSDKTILRALRGERMQSPPVWMMRQAGRYLPEYRATRAQAGDFLSLCYNPALAEEVSLQPIRRYGFDAAILFADILLIPQAMGVKLWFETGEGPRLSPCARAADVDALSRVEDIDNTLAPIYQTVARLSHSLPDETTLIGFAGAPWTVASYMIAGQGTADQAPAKALMRETPAVFEALLARLTVATIHYLDQQIRAGAEVVKLFDSWAGSLDATQVDDWVIAPMVQIVVALRAAHPDVPIIGFPRGLNANKLLDYVRATRVDAIAIDSHVDRQWAAQNLQSLCCVQGNLDQRLLISGGDELIAQTRAVCDDFAGGAHIFNLGHGITPDADPAYVQVMLDTVRNHG